ncbi:MAG: TIGR02147 family protein [Bdellovibrionaceae bacterium]|nr:TIGR02147 family protein [Pseudobdellovibrionaceae bacterium]MBX3032495.1 TIGR02147 family protein [Pseudobdellovibrionaceae bacterium]
MALAREMEDRCQRNPRYSLRAFARDLGLQPGKLSEILRGRCGLSGAMAGAVALKLRLNSQERRHFVAMVEAEHARSPLRREQAREELKTLEAQHGFSEIEVEKFKIISDWQHLAIHEAFLTKGFPGTAAAVARRFGLEENAALEFMERLAAFGMLEKNSDGTWKRIDVSLGLSSGVPTRDVRRHHRLLMEKAIDAMENVAVAERDMTSLTVAVPEAALPKVREMIKEFRRRLNREMEETPVKDRVYCLNVNFFPLDQKESQ